MVIDIVKLLIEAVNKIIFFYDHPYIIGITLALREREREREQGVQYNCNFELPVGL